MWFLATLATSVIVLVIYSVQLPVLSSRRRRSELEEIAHKVDVLLDRCFAHLVGLEEVRKELSKFGVGFLLREKRRMEGKKPGAGNGDDALDHFMVLGKPGVGKTTVAAALAKFLISIGRCDRMKKVSRADLVGSYVGQTERKTKKILQNKKSCIIIDEAYTLYQPGASGSDYGKIALEIILEAMSAKDNDIVVVLIGYEGAMHEMGKVNDGFWRRITQSLTIPDLTAVLMAAIFEKKVETKYLSLAPDVTTKWLETFFEENFKAVGQNHNGSLPVKLLGHATHYLNARVVTEGDMTLRLTRSDIENGRDDLLSQFRMLDRHVDFSVHVSQFFKNYGQQLVFEGIRWVICGK
ncbi:P-loop containing nucleoside triphosphate hydrolase protein [Obelidium mucronatum]|nr:P-loop containing nucleoside triphosphate hydrolase protein [Obelidium mucronatum]